LGLGADVADQDPAPKLAAISAAAASKSAMGAGWSRSSSTVIRAHSLLLVTRPSMSPLMRLVVREIQLSRMVAALCSLSQRRRFSRTRVVVAEALLAEVEVEVLAGAMLRPALESLPRRNRTEHRGPAIVILALQRGTPGFGRVHQIEPGHQCLDLVKMLLGLCQLIGDDLWCLIQVLHVQSSLATQGEVAKAGTSP
jgi:hypothetical protein